MAAKYILSALAAVFVIAAIRRVVRDGGRLQPQSRTWFLVATIFGAVSAWLWYAV